MSADLVRQDREENVTRLDDHRSVPVYRPDTDIYDDGDRVIIEADLPGCSVDDIDITLENGVLTIKSQQPRQSRSGWRPIYTEYGEGRFERSFALTDDIDQDKIDASVRNGVLRLELHRSESTKPRRISISAK
ncbi:Hsp20/alpha crystallin family protein [Parvularcula lutaonensis]|uniref:Hsp20/alpha crystallin family protein n=1 Tax=Parvularcula lutaonensis TaxID=491923 RepID=A0ABV7MCQ9_9PROT|nr:Hsp20/alpha crystallin family protein [Parvularcula lutaonensis]GGY38419.1 hypothetical protein GCM10007148_03410 [Parvularcula lutaonensis]